MSGSFDDPYRTGSFGLNSELARIDAWKHFNAIVIYKQGRCGCFEPTAWWPWPFTCNVLKGRSQNKWRRVRAWYPIGPPAKHSEVPFWWEISIQYSCAKEFEMSRKALAAKRKSLEKAGKYNSRLLYIMLAFLGHFSEAKALSIIRVL